MRNTFPNPSEILNGQHYPVLKILVDEGLLQVALFIGPPRSGTTATGKFGHQELHSHVNINQPGMFSRAGKMIETSGSQQKFVLSGRNRNAGIWRRVYDQVFDLYSQWDDNGISPDLDNPILLSAKETTHLILLDKEVDQWKGLAGDRVVMSIRHPVLQMRSALLMILDNIDTDIFSDSIKINSKNSFLQSPLHGEGFNVPRNGDVRDFSVCGRALIDASRLQSLLDSKVLSEDDNGKVSWGGVCTY